MSLRLTWRGYYTVYSTAILLLFYMLTGDRLLAILAVVPLALIVLDGVILLSLTRAPCRARLERSLVEVTLGDSKSVDVVVECRGLAGVEAPEGSSVGMLRGGSTARVTLRVHGLNIGFRRIESLRVARRTPLGLLELWESVALGLGVRVTPRVSRLILYAYGLLTGAYTSDLEPHEVSMARATLFKGWGEYRHTREYSPGDRFKYLDWKATGRTLKLMVKEYSSTPRAGLLVVDTRCIGAYTCDNILSGLLSIAVAYYTEHTPVLLYEVDKGRTLNLDPRGLLAYAISKSLEPEKASKLELYEYIPPATLGELRLLARGVPLESSKNRGVDVGVEGGSMVVVTPLVVGGKSLVDIVAQYRGKGLEVFVVTSRSPWLDSRDVEEAYSIYSTVRNIIGKLEELGAIVYACCPPKRVTSRNL